MATKKPTPAQLAARKKFAEMARSGALAKKRKTAAKKTAPKKRAANPVESNREKIRSIGKRTMSVMGTKHASVYIVEYSKDGGKNWKFLNVYGGPGYAKQRAEMFADEFPTYHVRVRSEVVIDK